MASVNEGDTLSPVIAGRDLKIDDQKLNSFRHSYRFLAYTRLLSRIELYDDLLGIDCPTELKKFYDAAFAWLKD